MLLNNPGKQVEQRHIFQATVKIRCQSRACHYHNQTLRPGDGNIQPIPVQQKTHTTRRLLQVAGAQAQKHHRCLLALKFIDTPDPGLVAQSLLEDVDLMVVGGHEQHLLPADTPGISRFVGELPS